MEFDDDGQCWCGFIVTHVPLRGGILVVGVSACVGAGDIWDIFVPSSQFCCQSDYSKQSLFKSDNKEVHVAEVELRG